MANALKVKISGLNEVQAALAELPREVQDTILKQAIDAAVEIVEDEAKRCAPVLTGKLRDSIAAREGKPKSGEAFRYTIGPRRVPYAVYVEYGTAHASAQPYMRPTYDTKKGPVVEKTRHDVLTEIDGLVTSKG